MREGPHVEANKQCAAGIQDDSTGPVGRPDLWHSGGSGNLSDGTVLSEADWRLP